MLLLILMRRHPESVTKHRAEKAALAVAQREKTYSLLMLNHMHTHSLYLKKALKFIDKLC